MGQRLQITGIALAAALTLAGAPNALAQGRPPQIRMVQQGARPFQPVPGRPGAANPQMRRMLDLPPQWANQLRSMTPQQQERFLANNERFQSLPPGRQEQIRNQLRVWNNLAPEQRQSILERQQVWNHLTPQQQTYVRNTLLPQWQEMRPVRRQAILQRLHDLRGLDDQQRAAKLNEENFMAGLGPRERDMLRDLSNLRVSPGEPENSDF